jgi:O-antigen/teichoic acid export membrane protein
MNIKNKRLMNNTFIFMIGNIGSKFIQFFLVPLYTYTLSTAQYGVTELVLTASNLLMPVFSISIADGMLRFGLDKTLKKGSVLKCSLFIVFMGTIASVLMIPVFRLNRILHEWLVFFLIILNLRIYRDVFAINLKMNDKNKLFAIDSIIYTFVLCGASVIFLVWVKMGMVGYFLAYVVANIISIVFLILVGNPIREIQQSPLERKLLKRLILYSIPMIINGISWWITNASDRFMLEWFMTESDVGIYSVAAKIPSFITTFTSVFTQAWIISSVIEYDSEKEKRFYSETFHKYYVTLFMGAALLLTIIKPFMKIYVSLEFYSAWQYAAFLICSSIVSGICAFTVGIYAATKKNMHIMVTTVIGAVINIILNYLLIPQIGIMGAAIATYISWGIIAYIRLFDIRKFFPFQIDYKGIVIYTLLTLFQCIFITYDSVLGIPVSVLTIVILSVRERGMIKGVLINVKGRLVLDKG